MIDIRYNADANYQIDAIGYVSVQRNKGHSFEYHNGKDRNSFIYVQRGMLDYYFTDTNKKIRIEKGTMLYVPKQLPYKTEYLIDDTKIKIIVFDTADDTLLPSEPAKFNSTEISSVFESITLYNTQNMLYLASKIYEILYIVNDHINKIPKQYKNIFPAIKEMNHRYYENCKIETYAKMCYMSEQHFRKIFKAYTGYSPIEYRNNLRLSAVKRMVESGEFKVSEAAYLAGFNNMSFFYSIYKKFKGDVN